MYETFEIQSYKLRLTIMRYGVPQSGIATRYWYQRIIEVTSQPQYHGIVIRAFLNFSNLFDLFGNGDVGRMDTHDPYKPIIYTWLPSHEYSFWYEILRAESPLTFEYSGHYDDSTYTVDHVGLRTSTEPIGEGPVDFGPYPEGFLTFRRQIISRPSSLLKEIISRSSNLPKARKADK